MSAVLTVNQLRKVYPPEKKGGNPFVAVDGISFALQEGEILGLLGPNGAGKSTTISMLLGVLSPTSGEILYGELEFKKHRTDILNSVTFASTYIKMPWRLTVMENLKIYSMLYGLSNNEFLSRSKKFLEFFNVWNQRDKTMNQLSAGQMTRVMLAKAFIPYPKIVLLDEPTASLDPDIAHEVRHFVLEQQREYNTSILYTSHNMDEVTEVCDRVVFLRNGSIVATDTPDKLAASVSIAHMRLQVKDGMKRTQQFAEKLGLKSMIDKREIAIDIDEHEIAAFLQKLAAEKIEYTQITIAKPSLEDFFLSQAGK
ncbi:MAG: ABC transporter ATP-binding protein [bacterium]|nr:ABC transporter ATP-binding protein [bacterium]